jgi:hypothetical protein
LVRAREILPPQFFAQTTPMPAGQPIKAVAAGEFL